MNSAKNVFESAENSARDDYLGGEAIAKMAVVFFVAMFFIVGVIQSGNEKELVEACKSQTAMSFNECMAELTR